MPGSAARAGRWSTCRRAQPRMHLICSNVEYACTIAKTSGSATASFSCRRIAFGPLLPESDPEARASGPRRKRADCDLRTTMTDTRTIAAIVVAAGRGERASANGETLPKQYRLLAGLPMLQRTLAAMLSVGAIHRVLPVIGSEHGDLYAALGL